MTTTSTSTSTPPAIPAPTPTPQSQRQPQPPPQPPPQPQRPQSTTLLTLPPELHLQITTHIPLLPDLYHLKQTCTYFAALLPTPTHEELLAAESTSFAITHDLYACRYCLRLRPAQKFADRMLVHGRGRYGEYRGKRFCVECGVLPRGAETRSGGLEEARYGPGDLVRIQGVAHVYCRRCGGLRRVVGEWDGGCCEGYLWKTSPRLR
ncbi:hypothetical protein BO71DRAFT_451999 [Aspergillus ellipticus CBS 707.79]|uniref:F-box domain-containing protein n=1 Tax=Aspergillus ellipticus CBS 707.79 TaxID=1448320 RepID=A0A319D2X6_9EURO|nr:hypothetical protein BO71DRAFT_451999 [Aspergillus ellipticus CBS 707.79]